MVIIFHGLLIIIVFIDIVSECCFSSFYSMYFIISVGYLFHKGLFLPEIMGVCFVSFYFLI